MSEQTSTVQAEENDLLNCEHPQEEWEIEESDPSVGLFGDYIWCGVCGATALEYDEPFTDFDGVGYDFEIRRWERVVPVICCDAGGVPERQTFELHDGNRVCDIHWNNYNS